MTIAQCDKATNDLLASPFASRGGFPESNLYRRRNELNQLRWGDLHLDGPVPLVCAPASITKNNKEAKLPLRPEVVEALRSIRPGDATPFQWVFHGQVPRVTTFQRDLTKAGIVFIDESGRRLDFHALRGTFCTMLAVNKQCSSHGCSASHVAQRPEAHNEDLYRCFAACPYELFGNASNHWNACGPACVQRKLVKYLRVPDSSVD